VRLLARTSIVQTVLPIATPHHTHAHTQHIDADEIEQRPITDANALPLLRDINLLVADERLLVAEKLLHRLEAFASTGVCVCVYV
jgi:hypothetical protein